MSTARQTKPERALGKYRVTLRRVETVTVEIEAFASARAIEAAEHLAQTGQIPACDAEWTVEGCEKEE